MFDDIVQDLLEGQEYVVAHFCGQRPRRQALGFIEPATNPRGAEEILREPSKIRYQTVQRIVLRIDRPNNFVHGPNELAGGAVDLIDVGDDLCLSFDFATDALAQHRDASETRAEIIVDVPGDTGTLSFNRMLPLHLLES